MTESNGVRVRDPVCGKVLGLAEAVTQQDHGGWAHFFCSAACRDAFGAAPNRYRQNAVPQRAAILEPGD